MLRELLQLLLGFGPALLGDHVVDRHPVAEIGRRDDIEQRHAAVRVAGPAAGETQRQAHFLGLVDDDEEDALVALVGGLGHGVRLSGRSGSPPSRRAAPRRRR